MTIFDVLALFGGLALFLYGMRLMGDGLKESSSGALKKALESVTNNPFKAFLLGVGVTAVIQSSTATIVITSGLVAAGLISLHQSLGIIVGANVGTTVTGQILRAMGINNNSATILQFFKPSTLAPIALIIGIILIMGFKFKRAKTMGQIAMGFGILFSGLMNMTGAVDKLAETGVFDNVFANLGTNPVLGYTIGAGVAFILQSSSAAVGILQAFSLTGALTFSSVYAVIVGIYLGDCVTTAIVCSIGARPDAKRVGIVNILFNLGKTAAVLIVVAILKSVGVLDGIWNTVSTPGSIADTNTVFNLVCAIGLLPLLPVFEKLSHRIVKSNVDEDEFKYQAKLEAMSPVFFSTPALALNSTYEALLTMFTIARKNIARSLTIIRNYDQAKYEKIAREEAYLDQMTDRVSEYLVDLSSYLTEKDHLAIMNQYYKVVNEFERLGDHAKNIADTARDLADKNSPFSETALAELDIMEDLVTRILDLAELSFKKRNEVAAYQIEPLEEVVDDLVVAMRTNHMGRQAAGECNVVAGTDFMDLLGDIERISDLCSNIGLATVTRVYPDLANKTHDYSYFLHSGSDEKFNQEYEAAHREFFARLEALSNIPE